MLTAVDDAGIMIGRSLLHTRRALDTLLLGVLLPVTLLLLFVYVFGGAISPTGEYLTYVVPGIVLLCAGYGAAAAGVPVAHDMTTGAVDRFRSLPILRSAVLIGHVTASLLRNLFSTLLVLAVAFAIGFRFEGGLVRAVAATLLLFFFSYAFSWIQALVGLSAGSVEAANSAGFLWMFPMTFVSSAFVDPANMPGWLQPIANNNPFTIVTNAARALYNGRDAGSDLWVALAWAIGITVVFAFLAIRKFNSAASR
jgi:ABC transporter DrrB family efflux protein